MIMLDSRHGVVWFGWDPQHPCFFMLDSRHGLVWLGPPAPLLLYAGFETWFGWDPQHLWCWDPILAKHISNPDFGHIIL